MQKPEPKHISTAPGVYLYSDAQDRVIYVGKAKNLRKRVMSYFRANVPSKTAAMLAHADSLKTVVTATEKEALLLEATLIKKHRPRYNIVLRDDKDHILFRLDTAQPFPRLEIVRRVRPGRGMAGKLLFGPFSSAGAARETWKAIHKVFPLRRCGDRAFANRSRPCLYHHMGQCLAPCVLDVDRGQYAAFVRQVVLLLRGKSGELLSLLQEEMLAAAEALDFERAAALRDRMAAVRQTVERQAVVLDVARDMDVLGAATLDGGLAVCILFVRGGILLDKRIYFWPDLALDDAPHLLESFLLQFYQTGLPVPPRIVAPWFGASAIDAFGQGAPGEAPAADAGLTEGPDRDASGPGASGPNASGPGWPAAAIGDALEEDGEKILSGEEGGADRTGALAAALGDLRGGTVVLAPPRGKDEEALVSLAAANAAEMRRQPDAVPMAEQLKVALRAARPIDRIEAVDVSHTGGRETRVGMVVFDGERPDKSAYRTYAVDAGGDDYAALYQWAVRRAKSGAPWPDLLLVDGGRGQLASVVRAFSEAGVTDAFAIAGIAKARTEDGRADRRAGNDADRIFLPGRSNPLPIAPGSSELFFLQHVRDTVHDFAIGRHRKARTSRAMAGELLRIPGVGPKTARLLWQHFGSLQAMAEADEATLAAIPGIGPRLAASLVRNLAKLHM